MNPPWQPSGPNCYLKFKQRSQARIPAWDYDIDSSELEITCRYSTQLYPSTTNPLAESTGINLHSDPSHESVAAQPLDYTQEIHRVHKWTKRYLNLRSRVMQLMKQVLYPQATTADYYGKQMINGREHLWSPQQGLGTTAIGDIQATTKLSWLASTTR